MKRIISLILGLVLSISLYAQGKGFTLQFNNEPLTTALKKIERSGGKNILFAYQETDKYKVTGKVQPKGQKEALDFVLKGKPFSYVERSTYFVVQFTGKVAQEEVVKGSVLDEHGQPLPYANVVLLSAADKSFIGGCVTDEEGRFVLPFSAKNAWLKVSFVGYKSQTLACQPMMNVKLQPNTQQLQAVVVKSKRPDVVYQNGAFVAQVAGTILSEMGTVEDMIGQLPFVTGEDGNWNVIGRGAPEIYLNGRKVRNLTELKSLSAKDILKAEIVTLPGAQYSAKTNAVIRLRAVRKRGQGWSGGAYTEYEQGHYSPHTFEDVKLNYRTGGLDIFGEVNTGFDRKRVTSHMITQLNTTNDWQFHTARTANKNGGGINLNTGFNYEVNDHQSLGMRYETGNIMGNNYLHSWGNTEVTRDGTDYESLEYDSYSKQNPHWSHSLNAYYNGDFGKWNVNFNGDYYNKVTKNTQMAFNDGRMDAESSSKVKSELYAAKLEVTAPLWKGSLTFGTEETFTNRWNDFTQSGYASDAFNHIQQNIYAGFVEYYGQINKRWAYGLGVRYESQKTSYYEKGVLQEAQSPSYHDWLPFASISYSDKDLNLAFGYRLNKYSPDYDMLQTSVDYVSKYEYSGGEPLLKPQQQHGFNLSGSYKWVSLMANFNYVKDMYMTWYKPYNEETHPNVLFQTMASIPDSYYWGVNVRLAPSIGIWYPNLTVGVDGYHETVDFLHIDQVGNQPKFNFNMSNNLKLPHRWFLNLSGYLSTRAAQGHGVSKCMGAMQFRVSKNFLKDDALKVMLVLRDVLHTGYYYFEAYGTKSHRDYSRYTDNQNIGINVRYTFNATRNKYKGSGAGQSEKQRL